jgi:hypothetical protein
MQRLKIEILVPDEHVGFVLEALHASGAGRIGAYDHCASLWRVNGRWRPLPGASPFRGEVGEVMEGSETRVESVCDVRQATDVVAAVRAVHPYEEPVIRLLPLYELEPD